MCVCPAIVGTLHSKPAGVVIATHPTRFLFNMKREELIERFRAYCSDNEMDFSLDDIQLIFTPDERSLGSNFFSSGVIGQTLRRNCLRCNWMIQANDCGSACGYLGGIAFLTFWTAGWSAGSIGFSFAIPILPVAIVVCVVLLYPAVMVGSYCFRMCIEFKRLAFQMLCIPLSVQTQQLYGKDYFLLERRGLFTMSEEEHDEENRGITCWVKELNVKFFSMNELTNIRFEVEPTEIPEFAKLSRYTLDENDEEQSTSAVLPDSIAKRIAQFGPEISDVV